ncbi:hemolysin family protein [Pandoraea sputorum]|uniref:Polyamine export protein n=1 Tax=Pandoraea sputorum TaxID=93222 RepID=A0A239SR16_9BURK|nr:hemolysin family protein [Pandoraea sputorum]APD12573.1 magnesium transporter [Pandoraea sputorum]SNU87682.1 Putative Mg2+ and Co2+ transporter CorB [Pandoraea sputorum]VVE49253.1 magnesium transporter [Pandoraea sputorum]VVE78357.1 magnesium transporter [Pandoraea sputorum]VVE85611.1 magnesium transporter [Pandoraea sputorum]
MSGYGFLFSILLLVLASAFFSAAEISLTAAKRTKLQVLMEKGDEQAVKVLALKEQPGNFFTVVQIGVNAVAVLGGVLGESFLTGYIFDWLSPFTDEALALRLAGIGSFLFITIAFIQFADLIPKRLAMVNPERVAMAIIDPMLLCLKILRPLVYIFNGVANLFLRMFKLPTHAIDNITSEDIAAMVGAGAQAGVLRKQELHLIENVFELESRTVGSVMTFRDDVVYFTIAEDERSIRQKITESPHSKYLVCRDEIDNVLGYVDSKDLLQRIASEDLSSVIRNLDRLYAKKLLVIPDTLNLSEALARFKETREGFAVIINEYGLVVGVVTLNDIVGALMGDVVHPADEDQIVQRDEHSWLVDGVTSVEDVKKALDIDELPGEGEFETIAGFMIYQLKRIPKKSEATEAAGYKFEVVDIDNYKIDQLLVTRIGAVAEAAIAAAKLNANSSADRTS